MDEHRGHLLVALQVLAHVAAPATRHRGADHPQQTRDGHDGGQLHSASSHGDSSSGPVTGPWAIRRRPGEGSIASFDAPARWRLHATNPHRHIRHDGARHRPTRGRAGRGHAPAGRLSRDRRRLLHAELRLLRRRQDLPRHRGALRREHRADGPRHRRHHVRQGRLHRQRGRHRVGLRLHRGRRRGPRPRLAGRQGPPGLPEGLDRPGRHADRRLDPALRLRPRLRHDAGDAGAAHGDHGLRQRRALRRLRPDPLGRLRRAAGPPARAARRSAS